MRKVVLILILFSVIACTPESEKRVQEYHVVIKVQLSESTELVFTPDKIKGYDMAGYTDRLYVTLVNGEERMFSGYRYTITKVPKDATDL
jgi:hypothetical protein